MVRAGARKRGAAVLILRFLTRGSLTLGLTGELRTDEQKIFSRYGTVSRKLPCPQTQARSIRWSEGQTTVSAPHSNQTCTFGRQKSSRIFTCQCGPPPKLKGREELEAVCLSDMMVGAACQLSMLRLRLKCSHGNHSTPPLAEPQNRSVFVVAMRSTQIPNPCWNLRMAELRVVDVQTNTRKELPR
jgi:hypothetical protein